ncbi:MAG: hypothetical protein HYT80_04575 [Euryarchaeota archaeon]|nr:hypothetical protein [Euryarchaeota archaeon]
MQQRNVAVLTTMITAMFFLGPVAAWGAMGASTLLWVAAIWGGLYVGLKRLIEMAEVPDRL